MTNEHWYAVKTLPGAQQPRRRYEVEQTTLGGDGRPRGKGYRIVPSLNHDKSAVEQALEDRGFQYYMPAEKRLVRDRRKTDLWKKRRFALMVGYVFVHAPRSFMELRETPGVRDVVKTADGFPYPVPLSDILFLRAMEAKSEAEFDEKARLERWKLRKKAKVNPTLQRIIEDLDNAGLLTVKTEELEAAE
jgi:hypothetical protein